MIPLQIKAPIWKTRSIGIAEQKFGSQETLVEILYKAKDGLRMYPHVYRIATANIKKYPVQIVHNTRLRIIPIADLEIVDDMFSAPVTKTEALSSASSISSDSWLSECFA